MFFRLLDIGSTPKNTKQQLYTNINKLLKLIKHIVESVVFLPSWGE